MEGSEISMFYDPMISKLCTHSRTRTEAINEMINALDRYYIEGVKTNRDFLSNILQKQVFIQDYTLQHLYLMSILMVTIPIAFLLKIKKYFTV